MISSLTSSNSAFPLLSLACFHLKFLYGAHMWKISLQVRYSTHRNKYKQLANTDKSLTADSYTRLESFCGDGAKKVFCEKCRISNMWVKENVKIY
jgi:hypothetical protein